MSEDSHRIFGRARRARVVAIAVLMLAPHIHVVAAEVAEVTEASETALATESSVEVVERYALEHNPAIVGARRAFEAAERRIPQVRAYENPRLTYSPDTGSMAETRAGPQKNGVGFSQAIPFPGKLTLKGEVAAEEARAANERYQAVAQEVLRQVRSRYADYYLATRSLEVNEAVTDLARQFAEIAEAKYRVGKGAQQDVIQAREEVSRLRADRVMFEGERESSLGALNALLDRPSRAVIAAPGALGAEEIEAPLARLLDAATEARPELRAQGHLVEASRRALRLAKMDYLPDFSVGGQYTEVEGGTNPMFTKDGHDIWMATFGISVPIWVDRIQAGVEERRARLGESESMLRDLRNRVHDEAQRAYERAQVAARTERIYRTTLIPQTDQRIESARAGYQTNRVDFLTLVDSLQSLERVRLDRYRAVREYHRSLADLERAVGAPIGEISTEAGAKP